MSDNAKFLRDLEKYIEDQKKTLKTVVEKVIVGVVQTLVYRSPVGQPEKWTDTVRDKRLANGYEPGRYISSWKVSFDFVPSPGYNGSIDSSGNGSVNSARNAMLFWHTGVNNVTIVNTAENPDTGEYYPVFLQKKKASKFPGYKKSLKSQFPELTYDYFQGMQDDVIGTFSKPRSSEFALILQDAVRSTK